MKDLTITKPINTSEKINFHIQQMKKTLSVIRNENVSMESVTSSLAYVLEINQELIKRYELIKLILISKKKEYKQFYDEKMALVKMEMNKGKPASTKIAVKEYEIEFRNTYRDEYNRLNDEIEMLEFEKSYILRQLNFIDSYQDTLRTISSNMRSELKAFGLV